jgi:hypothetical protein
MARRPPVVSTSHRDQNLNDSCTNPLAISPSASTDTFVPATTNPAFTIPKHTIADPNIGLTVELVSPLRICQGPLLTALQDSLEDCLPAWES